jgi:hypothetical protein
MKPIIKIDDTDYMQVRYTADRFKPIIRTKTLERKKIGSWLFGLLPVYEYYYSDWSEK